MNYVKVFFEDGEELGENFANIKDAKHGVHHFLTCSNYVDYQGKIVVVDFLNNKTEFFRIEKVTKPQYVLEEI